MFYSIAEIYADSVDSSAYLKLLRVSGILVFNDLAAESSCVFFHLSYTLLTSKFWELLNSEFFLLKKRPEVSIISLLKLGRNAYFKKENNSLL